MKSAEADLQKARESAGERNENNAQLISARSAVEKAELDLKRTKVVAPSRGVVNDLRTDVGQYAQPGAPAMTLIAIHDLWINADMTENNLGNIKPGDQVDIVLDVMPGEMLKGRVRSVFVRYFTAILIDLVVLNLFVEYSKHVNIDSFTMSLLAAVLLQILLKVTLAIEHRVAAYFKARPGRLMTFLRWFFAWLVLFGSKFVILEALSFTFGDKVRFEGPWHGIVALISCWS